LLRNSLEYRYYPDHWPELYLGRRREVGWASLRDCSTLKRAIELAHLRGQDRNFTFFGAPVGMILTMDRRLGLGALNDFGMSLEALVVAAHGFGLATCVQGALWRLPRRGSPRTRSGAERDGDLRPLAMPFPGSGLHLPWYSLR
jgi:nitroreductase